jgi:hypothetical protein
VIKEEDDVAGLEDPAVDVDDQESSMANGPHVDVTCAIGSLHGERSDARFCLTIDEFSWTCASVALLKLWTGAGRESAPRFLVEPVAPTTPPCTLKATKYTDITLQCNHPLFLEFCECV